MKSEELRRHVTRLGSKVDALRNEHDSWLEETKRIQSQIHAVLQKKQWAQKLLDELVKVEARIDRKSRLSSKILGFLEHGVQWIPDPDAGGDEHARITLAGAWDLLEITPRIVSVNPLTFLIQATPEGKALLSVETDMVRIQKELELL